jgi:N-acetylglucosaminyl-diphospho-decaprenol L-rhamnosyltransferase
LTAAGVAPAAVVVSYNVRDLLVECLASLRADGIEEIVVVDNASSDGSVDAVRAADPGASVIALTDNLGFGAAANRGVAATSTPVVLVMNPDLVVEPGANKALVEALEGDLRLGLVGPRIDTPDGQVYPSARRFPDILEAAGHGFLGFVWPNNPYSRRYRMLDWDHDRPADVDWVAGTYLAVRRVAWDQLGGFDERYFMYLEDVDLCWRMWRTGWRVGYAPEARITHAIGQSTDQTPYRMIVAHHRSLLRYSVKTLAGARRLLLPVVGAGLAVRCALACLQRLVRRRPHAAL